MTPEAKARQQIDVMLTASGWVVQDYNALNPSARQGIAVREVPLKSGRCDYLLLVDRVPVGVIEAKKQGNTLSAVADQSGHYAENLPDFLAALTPGRLRFLYESTGAETFFRDEADPRMRDNTESRPLERLPTVDLEKMLKQVAFGDRSEDTLTSLASRLARLDRAITAPRRAELTQLAGGKTLAELSAALLRAFDPDVIAEKATGIPGASPDEVDPASSRKPAPSSRSKLANRSTNPRCATLSPMRGRRPIRSSTSSPWTKSPAKASTPRRKKRPKASSRSFREYIEHATRRDQGTANPLQPHLRQRLTEDAQGTGEQTPRHPAAWTPDPLADAYRQVPPAKVQGQLRRFADLVSLVRFALEQEPILEPFEEHVRQRFNTWLEEKLVAGITFEPDQLAWLEKMRDYISARGSVDNDHLEADNVLGPINRAFGERLWPLMEELKLGRVKIQDVLVMLNQMQADGVIERFAIGGAVGATFYLEPVDTLDVDVFITFKPDPGSLIVSPSAIFDYLRGFGCQMEGEYIVIGGWPVQFLPPTGPLVEEALAEAVTRDVEEIATRVFTAEHLAAIALQTGRAKDKARLLQFVEEGALDAERFQQIIARHALVNRWQQFQRQFLDI